MPKSEATDFGSFIVWDALGTIFRLSSGIFLHERCLSKVSGLASELVSKVKHKRYGDVTSGLASVAMRW